MDVSDFEFGLMVGCWVFFSTTHFAALLYNVFTEKGPERRENTQRADAVWRKMNVDISGQRS